MYRRSDLQLSRRNGGRHEPTRLLHVASMAVVLLAPMNEIAHGSTAQTIAPAASQHSAHETWDEPSAHRIGVPADVAFPGTIRLQVDATDIAHRVFQVRETIPVTAGRPLTLLFPQWTTGDHTPNGPLDKLSGIVITANGQRLRWVRDTVEVYAFHVNVPKGVATLDLEYQYLGSTEPRVGAVLITPTMLDLQWQTVVLYPAGYYSRRIQYEASVILPKDWQFACALDGAVRADDRVGFARVNLENRPRRAYRWHRTRWLSA